MDYDTIIIGAGLSGLAAGIRLAYYEKKVCILERHTTIGGLNSFYRLRNRNYDVGLHAMTNFAAPTVRSAPLNRLCRQLRIRREEFELVPQVESATDFPGHRLRWNNDYHFFEQQIADEFPRQIDGFSRFVSRMKEQDSFALTRDSSSARTVLAEYLSEPVLVEMLLCPVMFYGSASARDMDFNQFCIMFQSLFLEGMARPEGGVKPILKTLVRKFKSHGGELKLRAGVRRILNEGNRTTGVELDNGDVLSAENVLSSAGAAETFALCGFPKKQSHLSGEISFVELIFILDCEPGELGFDKSIIFFNRQDDFVYDVPETPIDRRSGILCVPNNFHHAQPLEDGRIRITFLANPEYWLNLPEEEYVAAKEKWQNEILQSVQQQFQPFEEHIVDRDMFTPRTIKKFTGHFNGCVYGSPEKILDGKTPLKNLYLCGTDQGFLGIVGAMLSGISMTNAYLLK